MIRLTSSIAANLDFADCNSLLYNLLSPYLKKRLLTFDELSLCFNLKAAVRSAGNS